MISQHHISGALLLAVRQTEAQRGTLLAHHGRHPAALRPTESRRHKITDRHARKVKARQYHPGNPLNNFKMGTTEPLVPHRHSSARV